MNELQAQLKWAHTCRSLETVFFLVFIFFHSASYIITSIMAPPAVLTTFSVWFSFETLVLHSNKHNGGKCMSASILPAGQLRLRSDSDNITVHASLKNGERGPDAGQPQSSNNTSSWESPVSALLSAQRPRPGAGSCRDQQRSSPR